MPPCMDNDDAAATPRTTLTMHREKEKMLPRDKKNTNEKKEEQGGVERYTANKMNQHRRPSSTTPSRPLATKTDKGSGSWSKDGSGRNNKERRKHTFYPANAQVDSEAVEDDARGEEVHVDAVDVAIKHVDLSDEHRSAGCGARGGGSIFGRVRLRVGIHTAARTAESVRRTRSTSRPVETWISITTLCSDLSRQRHYLSITIISDDERPLDIIDLRALKSKFKDKRAKYGGGRRWMTCVAGARLSSAPAQLCPKLAVWELGAEPSCQNDSLVTASRLEPTVGILKRKEVNLTVFTEFFYANFCLLKLQAQLKIWPKKYITVASKVYSIFWMLQNFGIP
ncbi:hypothetical protein GALMADRAFT_209950 [Galerina marginata CBS 339.88]|uniref:Uncharacterized protein n=1 Tax=Galerina marginata (strain CBS 339.88) TaxID=685588 RepID=A0A067T3F6_GALM3|nr:hypothetical protein GALMADRAFT_209950 [Galerina marginata CBS 339.88]